MVRVLPTELSTRGTRVIILSQFTKMLQSSLLSIKQESHFTHAFSEQLPLILSLFTQKLTKLHDFSISDTSHLYRQIIKILEKQLLQIDHFQNAFPLCLTCSPVHTHTHSILVEIIC